MKQNLTEPLWIQTHRELMVAHFVMLRSVDKEYARYALAKYLEYPPCPCPDIADDVKKAWNETHKM